MVNTHMSMSRILIVDDEQDIRDIARLLLESAGYMVLCAEDGRTALKLIEDERVDLVVTDMLMPEMDGVELINELRRRRPNQRIMAISGGGRAPKESYLQIAHLCGAQGVLAKPFNRDQLLKAVFECGVSPETADASGN